MNVKVLLLPDGEDPDSFSRRMSATELVDYLNKNEKDFISFKTNLLLKDVENDPAKRAAVISDVVRSISIIPNSITRAVYIRECSKLLDTNEEVLYTEINKLRKGKNEKGPVNTDSETRNLPVVPPENAEISHLEIAEKELIRVLMLFGKEVFHPKEDPIYGHDMTVSEFILKEIQHDELEFVNPVYKKIYNEIKQCFEANQELDSKYFIQHADNHISRLATDLFSTPYQLSKIWSKKGTFVETEDMKIRTLIPERLMDFKSKKVQTMLKETELLLMKAQQDKDIDEIMQLQKKYMMLTNFKKELSKGLGNRIIL
ncbi:MAG: hypothetical protein HC830_08430 [Bacteroidetes bacterium]|nr:hypothetical protein [Bacteroidota bacterium]